MKKILIIEDELPYLRLLTEYLKNQKYEVVTAGNGEEGLKVAAKEHPNLILLDIRMPVMDGVTMLDKLRKEKYGQKVDVIILTNLEPDSGIIEGVLKDQPTYYLIKSDIKLEELTNKIKELI